MMEKSLQEVYQQFRLLNSSIRDLLKDSTYENYGDLSGLKIDYEDADELFLLDQLKWVTEKLADAHYRVKYLGYPIRENGILRMTPNGRYATGSGYEYTSGDLIEGLISDDYHEHPYWVRSSVEHNGTGYYIVGHSEIPMEGLQVRIRTTI